jgi:hypothetical protein
MIKSDEMRTIGQLKMDAIIQAKKGNSAEKWNQINSIKIGERSNGNEPQSSPYATKKKDEDKCQHHF